MQNLRAFLLAAAFFCLTVASIPIQWLSIRLRLPLQKSYPNVYHRFLTRMIGIRVTVIGTPVQDRGVLMIANHTSYFDILVMSAVARVSFVAKSEVSRWFFFGLMAKLQRTVFVERTKRARSGESRDLIRRRLIDGDALVLFPEGTSTDGNRVLPFKSSLLGAAETDLGTGPDGQPVYAPVQPVSISYVGLYGMPLGRENRPFYAWYGDMDLLDHLWEAFMTGPLDVIVEFHPPLTIEGGRNRKEIARQAEVLVRDGQFRALRGNWGSLDPGKSPETAAV